MDTCRLHPKYSNKATNRFLNTINNISIIISITATSYFFAKSSGSSEFDDHGILITAVLVVNIFILLPVVCIFKKIVA